MEEASLPFKKNSLGVEACLIYSLENFFPVGFPRKKRSWYIFVGFSCTQKSNKVESQWEIDIPELSCVRTYSMYSTRTFFVISEKSGTFVIIFIRYIQYIQCVHCSTIRFLSHCISLLPLTTKQKLAYIRYSAGQGLAVQRTVNGLHQQANRI